MTYSNLYSLVTCVGSAIAFLLGTTACTPKSVNQSSEAELHIPNSQGIEAVQYFSLNDTVTHDTGTIIPQIAISGAISYLSETQFEMHCSKTSIPIPVLQFFERINDGYFDIADCGQSWNAGCGRFSHSDRADSMFDFPPSMRLTFVGLIPEFTLVAYQSGGFTVTHSLWAFSFSEDHVLEAFYLLHPPEIHSQSDILAFLER